MEELMLKIDNVSKMYKLGQIGGTTLRDELQRKRAKLLGKEDPTKKIGAKEYKSGETFMALNGVSFEVKKGERVGIIGHNGAGKSTLLKLLSRVTAPTSGTIGLNGRVASMLEVGTGFHGELTGRENIYMNGAILGMTKKEIDSKIEDIIEFSECRQFIDTPVKRYSSGMYVKLAFSVAAHLDSEIMIMDEVLAVGDMAFQKKCLDKMSQVSKDEVRTILYVSHNMNTIRQLCDRVVVLDHGKVVFDGGVEEGIDVYLGYNKIAEGNIIELSDIRRPDKAKKNANITKLEFLNGTSSIFRGERLCLKLNWKAMETLRDVRFRVIVFFLSGNAVGTAQSYVLGDFTTGSYVNELELDTSTLAEGNYYMGVGLYSLDTRGGDIIYDHIEKACGFEILKSNKDCDLVVWGNAGHEWYGDTVLPTLVVK